MPPAHLLHGMFRRIAWRIRFPVHPPREVLERFVRGDLPPGDFSRVFQHLLRGCGRCRAVTSALWNIGMSPEGCNIEYERTFERVFSNVRRAVGELETERYRRTEGERALTLHSPETMSANPNPSTQPNRSPRNDAASAAATNGCKVL